MEEKERYELESYHEAFSEIHDTKSDEWYLRKDLITDLLNQQDKEIKQAKENLSKFGNIINEQDKKIKELEALLKTVREFETPRIERYAVVQYIHWKNKPYKIVNCADAYKDKNGKIVQLWYSGQSHNFKVIKICNTEEEAKSLIKQLRENRCNG